MQSITPEVQKVLRDVCMCSANTLKCVIRQGHSPNIIAINHAARPTFTLQWQGWAYFYALLYLSSVLFMHEVVIIHRLHPTEQHLNHPKGSLKNCRGAVLYQTQPEETLNSTN